MFSKRTALSIGFALLAGIGAGEAESLHGQYSFGTERSCVASGKLPREQCANAAANAQAEFEEKAPRFPTREACARSFPRSGCSIGFSGADGWAGKKSGLYFAPRQTGFRISGRDLSVVPYVEGPYIPFSRRTIVRKEIGINAQRAREARKNWRPQAPGDGVGGFGVETPAPGSGGPLPPPPPVDPNFDCASVLEPSALNPETGCYLAPRRR